ncbi:MAG: FHA domain-containing protein [Tannerella sp.]|jgi:hypothetical protein|nr:FHA domain-containing protein [Tannerella sp.]
MISIKCPHCNVGLKVDEGKIPEGLDSFKCPKCKEEIPVSLVENKKAALSSTGNTVVLQKVIKKNGKLTVISDEDTAEQVFTLQEGIFIVGRKASVSNANICIETNDKSMSRNHLKIEVKKDAHGNLIHTISDNHSKNRTMYNGKYVEDGEVLVLKNNDEIVIGRTALRFNE